MISFGFSILIDLYLQDVTRFLLQRPHQTRSSPRRWAQVKITPVQHRSCTATLPKSGGPYAPHQDRTQLLLEGVGVWVLSRGYVDEVNNVTQCVCPIQNLQLELFDFVIWSTTIAQMLLLGFHLWLLFQPNSQVQSKLMSMEEDVISWEFLLFKQL